MLEEGREHIAVDAADAFVVVAPAFIPKAVIVIEGHRASGDELVGDFVEVVSKARTATPGNKAREAEAKAGGFVRTDAAAPPGNVRATANGEFTINGEPAVGDDQLRTRMENGG